MCFNFQTDQLRKTGKPEKESYMAEAAGLTEHTEGADKSQRESTKVEAENCNNTEKRKESHSTGTRKKEYQQSKAY